MGVQVQSATKYINEEGKLTPLSILKRQFISFSYGGKNIEDFDLLAVFSNDRLDKEIYAPFNDTTTEQAQLDGQLFWRSNFKAGQLDFVLATDGITSVQLEEFKNWFQPGIERELILSEYHNRATLARVSSSPQMSLLPFEKEVEVFVAGQSYKTKTSLYKGEISLSFVMDDPYWYSKESYINTTEEKDLKLIFEDGIPHVDMFNGSFLLAENKYYDGSALIDNPKTLSVSLIEQTNLKIYYCGTAKEWPQLTFSISAILDSSGYFSFGETSSDYYFVQIGEKQMLFSLPDILTSYNQAISIANSYEEGNSGLDLRAEIRDSISNYYIRAWAIAAVDEVKNNITGALNVGFLNSFIEKMKAIFQTESPSFKIQINCKKGIVLVTSTIAESYGSSNYITLIENAGNMIKSNYLTIEERTLPINGQIGEVGSYLNIASNITLNNFEIEYKYRYL